MTSPPAPASRLSSAYAMTFILAAVGIAALAINGYATVFDSLSTDDAMRLVQVRDLMNGQSWFDLVQHRLDVPNTTPLHWSRLVDLPLAVLISFFSLFVERTTAEALTLTLYPPLLLLPAMLALLKSTRILIGQDSLKLVLILSFTVAGLIYAYFRPSGIDHHNIQIVLILWMLAGLLYIPHARWGGICAGLCAAISLAVGPETTPLVLAGCAAAVLAWVFPLTEKSSAHAGLFGLAFGGSTLGLFFVLVPPNTYTTVWCDALSFPHAVVASIGGFGLAALALIPFKNPWFRSVGVGILGLVAVAVGVRIAPQCIETPLATLPPLVKELWLNNVNEAQNVFQIARTNLALFLFVYVLPCLTFLFALALLLKSAPQKRLAWAQYLLIFIAAMAITFWQVRGTMISAVLALLPLAAAIRGLGKPGDGTDWGWLTPKAVAFGVCFNGMTFLLIGGFLNPYITGIEKPDPARQEAASTCLKRASYLPLNTLPEAFIANPIDTGPYLLAWTHHKVLAAPYHRQTEGLNDSLKIFTSPPEEAEKYVRERGLTMLAWCNRDAQNWAYQTNGHEGLLSKLTENQIPAWLERIPLEHTPFMVYRVLPPASTQAGIE